MVHGRSVTVQRRRHSGNLKMWPTYWPTYWPTVGLAEVGAKDAYTSKKLDKFVLLTNWGVNKDQKDNPLPRDFKDMPLRLVSKLPNKTSNKNVGRVQKRPKLWSFCLQPLLPQPKPLPHIWSFLRRKIFPSLFTPEFWLFAHLKVGWRKCQSIMLIGLVKCG